MYALYILTLENLSQFYLLKFGGRGENFENRWGTSGPSKKIAR